MPIHEVFLTVTLIIQIQSGNQIGTASGFFYTQGERLFLITNKHVVDPQNGAKPEMLELKLHTDANNPTKNEILRVPLYANKKQLWLVHPKHQEADLALIEINRKAVDGQFNIRAFNSGNLLPSNYTLNPGDDLFIMGYPYGLHDDINNLPILRNALIASSYGINFKGQPSFLTDSNLHPGTSGSPVITKPKNNWITKNGDVEMTTSTAYYLVGIHSAVISITSQDGLQNASLGLGQAWYAELIEQIINQ